MANVIYEVDFVDDQPVLRSDAWAVSPFLGGVNGVQLAGSDWPLGSHTRAARLWVFQTGEHEALANDLHQNALTVEPGIVTTYALGINGQHPTTVVGGATRADGRPLPIRWTVNATALLPQLTAGGEAYGVNKAGDVVGYCLDGNAFRRAVRWPGAGGGPIDGGTLGGSQSSAMAINEGGAVTGWAETATGERHAFLAQPLAANGMLDLFPTGTTGQGDALNAAGDVAGMANGAGFLWSATEGLTTLEGTEGCIVRGINMSRQIVGRRSTASGYRAFVWQSGVIQDLDSLIEPGYGITLTHATAINDDGVIAAMAHADSLGPLEFGVRLIPLAPQALTSPGLPEWFQRTFQENSQFVRAIESYGRDARADAVLCLQLATLLGPVDDRDLGLQRLFLERADSHLKHARVMLESRVKRSHRRQR